MLRANKLECFIIYQKVLGWKGKELNIGWGTAQCSTRVGSGFYKNNRLPGKNATDEEKTDVSVTTPIFIA